MPNFRRGNVAAEFRSIRSSAHGQAELATLNKRKSKTFADGTSRKISFSYRFELANQTPAVRIDQIYNFPGWKCSYCRPSIGDN